MSETQTVTITKLPKGLRADIKDLVARLAEFHKVKFTGHYEVRRSYYLGTPRILISATKKGETAASGWNVDEIYNDGRRIDSNEFNRLWDMAQ